MASTDLTAGALRARAGSTSFSRGEDYVPLVRGLRLTESGASASIQGSTVYLVDLQWSGSSLGGHCTCPHHAKGYFCKHLVALGLAVLGVEAPTPQESEPDPLDDMNADQLRQLIRDLTEIAPEVARLVEVKGAGMLQDDPATSERLVGLVNATLRTRSYLEYRAAMDLAVEVERLLDKLEGFVADRRTRAVQPALLRAVTKLRTIVERADDSSGLLGQACQRAAELYAEACRAGHPDPPALARWLLKFRDTSPGWPDVRLEDFVDAFDDKALKTYRAGVARLGQKYDDPRAYERHEVDQMRLELADHDGDVDLAVSILNAGDHPKYGAIVDRLRAADRTEEASKWVDRALSKGALTPHPGGANDYWLDPADVATDLMLRGSDEDAIAVWRDQVSRAHDMRAYTSLLEFAEPLGLREREEAWVKQRLRERAGQPYGNGALLVQIAMAEGSLDEAWAIADELGPGHAWETLANASKADFPGRAALLHRAKVDDDLRVADSSRYSGIAAALVRVKELMERDGAAAEFASYVAGIRKTYKRRPSLMAALDRRAL